MSKLAYHHIRDNKGKYNISTYEAFIPQVVKELFKEEINENKKGVQIINGHYQYTPSLAYRRLLSKQIKKQTK